MSHANHHSIVALVDVSALAGVAMECGAGNFACTHASTGSSSRNDEKTVLDELVPTLPCPCTSGFQTHHPPIKLLRGKPV
jgi:hypothetical protein